MNVAGAKLEADKRLFRQIVAGAVAPLLKAANHALGE